MSALARMVLDVELCCGNWMLDIKQPLLYFDVVKNTEAAFMQIKGLHRNIYRTCRLESKINFVDRYKDLRDRLSKSIHEYEITHSKLSTQERKELGIISRPTYYRYRQRIKDLDSYIPPPKRGPKNGRKPKWSRELAQLVLKLRKENPTYGKKKLTVILARDYDVNTSESTVGRILKSLMSRGLVTKYAALVKPKRSRIFNGHAKAWSFKNYADMELGERVQVDHMAVNKNLRHFQFWERKSKFIVAEVYTNATSHSAKLALQKFMKEAPFKVKSLQVDGGSEFMAEFETECERLGVELLVLPPKRPTYNGGVERGNRTFREDFYNRYDLLKRSLTEIREDLTKAVHKYNNFRPHQHLHGLTPMEYITRLGTEVVSQK